MTPLNNTPARDTAGTSGWQILQVPLGTGSDQNDRDSTYNQLWKNYHRDCYS